MMLRPWHLRATLDDGAMMLEAVASMQPRYGPLQMPICISAGGENFSVKLWQSEKLHEEVDVASSIIPAIGCSSPRRPSGHGDVSSVAMAM
jgi:hypothetical protein